MVLAFLLSAEVPGVNVPLSPELLKDAAACCAFEMSFALVLQSAPSIAAKDILGTLPKAEEFNSAAINCCNSCILAWSSEDLLAEVDVLEMSLQKLPITFPRSSTGRPQITVSATPGKVCPNAVPPNQAILASGV